MSVALTAPLTGVRVPPSQNPAGRRPLLFSTFFSPYSLVSLFLSHYLFFIYIFLYSFQILSSLDLLDAAVTREVALEKGKIIGNKVNTLVGA